MVNYKILGNLIMGIGLILWCFLGGIMLYLNELGNYEFTIKIWAVTTGIMLILIMGSEIKRLKVAGK